ncbi:MAG: glycosyltransferase [Pseudomonadota bacterium]
MIPPIIHQTWKNNQLSHRWQSFANSWKRHHPDWEYMFWTDDDGMSFVDEHYPEFFAVYSNYPYNIQRADALRYLVLLHYGGLYADMDYECLQSFDAFRHEHGFLCAQEPHVHALQHGVEGLLCNALMLSKPDHLFLHEIINELSTQTEDTVTHSDVLSSTGPLMLQRVFDRTTLSDIEVLPFHVFCPLENGSKYLKMLDRNDDKSELVRTRLIEKGCFAVHHWDNSWMGELAGKLVNPEPANVAGFHFYPGLDSNGNDIENGGRNIPKLARKCLATEDAIAFNTDGFIKRSLRPPDQWTEMGCGDGLEGLYVKTRRLHEVSGE